MISWLIFFYVRFVIVSRKMHFAVHCKYRVQWAVLMGVALLTLLLVLYMLVSNFVVPIEQRREEEQLKPSDTLLGWLEFTAVIGPPLALIIVWMPQDIFEEYNKYPEHAQRVSILQNEHWRDTFIIANLNTTRSSIRVTESCDLATMIAGQNNRAKLEEAIEINQHISNDELISRYID